MTEQSAAPTDAPDEPGGEVFIVNGEPVAVPRRIEGEGREAIHRWHTDLEEPHAAQLAKRKGFNPNEIAKTGHGGRLVVADVERHEIALAKAKADAKAAAPAPVKPAATTDAPKEG